MEQTSDAQGDFLRTSDGLANQQRILEAQWKDLKATLGEGLLPPVTKAVSVTNDWLGMEKELIKAMQEGNITLGEANAMVREAVFTDKTFVEVQEYLANKNADVETSLRGVNDEIKNNTIPVLGRSSEEIRAMTTGMQDMATEAETSTDAVSTAFSDMAKSANQDLDGIIENMMSDMEWIASGGLELQEADAQTITDLNERVANGAQYAFAGAVTEMQALQAKSIVLKDEIAGISTTETAQQIATNMGIPLSNALELVKQIRANAQFDVTSYIRIVIQEQTSDLMRQGDDRVGGEVDLSGGDEGPGGANGLDMIVPQGYPNDSYNVRATSGERVTITPEETGGGVNYGGVTIVVQGAGDPRAVAEEVNRVLGRQARIAKLAGAQYGGI